jgi:ABC-type multidrug transport system permease subunit
LPTTYAVTLLRGIWHGDGWFRHTDAVLVLMVMFALFVAVSSRVFRWE